MEAGSGPQHKLRIHVCRRGPERGVSADAPDRGARLPRRRAAADRRCSRRRRRRSRCQRFRSYSWSRPHRRPRCRGARERGAERRRLDARRATPQVSTSPVQTATSIDALGSLGEVANKFAKARDSKLLGVYASFAQSRQAVPLVPTLLVERRDLPAVAGEKSVSGDKGRRRRRRRRRRKWKQEYA